MKKITLALLLSSTALLVPVIAAQAYSNQPQITSIDQTDVKQPVPHDVNWIPSDEVVAGDKLLDHYELNITDASTFADVCSVDVSADAVTYQLTSVVCPQMDVYGFYNAQLIEIYSDTTESSDENLTFYTNPPKPKSLKIKHRLANSLRLKFKRGVEIGGEYLYVDYIVARGKNTGKIVTNGEAFTPSNYIDVTDLPAGKSLQIKMRFRSNEYGNSAWSNWMKFKTKED